MPIAEISHPSAIDLPMLARPSVCKCILSQYGLKERQLQPQRQQ